MAGDNTTQDIDNDMGQSYFIKTFGFFFYPNNNFFLIKNTLYEW